MNELVDEITFYHDDLEKIEINVYVDESKGVETTDITIYLSDGTFRSYSSNKQM